MNYNPNNDPTWLSQPPVPPPPPKPPRPPLFDVKARRAYFKQYPQEQKKSLAIGCGVLTGILALCGICNALGLAGGSTNQAPTPTAQPTAKPTHQVLVLATEKPKMPTVAPTPSPTPEPTPTPTPEPVQQPPAQPPARQPIQPPIESGGNKNCSDFATHAQAQAYFVSHGGSPSNNVDGLDRDHDGIACEKLP